MIQPREPRPLGRTRAKQPTVFRREAVEAAHVRYLAGESSTVLAAEIGGSDRGLIYAFQRLGLKVKPWGKQPRRKRVKNTIIRGGKHECIYAEGECLGCGARRVA